MSRSPGGSDPPPASSPWSHRLFHPFSIAPLPHQITMSTPASRSVDLLPLTRNKLERMVSSRKGGLRQLVLLSNAFDSSSRLPSPASSTFPSCPEVEEFAIEHVEQSDDMLHESVSDEQLIEETKRKEMEWFEDVLDGMIETEELDHEDQEYVDVSLRSQPLFDAKSSHAQEEEFENGQRGYLMDSGFVEQQIRDYHEPFRIPRPLQTPIDLEAAALHEIDLPALTPDNSPLSETLDFTPTTPSDQVQLVPYSAPSLFVTIPQSLFAPHLLENKHKEQPLRLPIDLPAWDHVDFGPRPSLRSTLHHSEYAKEAEDQPMCSCIGLKPFSYGFEGRLCSSDSWLL